MPYTEIEIIDAIYNDLEQEVGAQLGTHQTYLYVEPRVLRIDLGDRFLLIYPHLILHEIISTVSDYENRNRYMISWREHNPYGAEANLGDREVARAALERANAIRDRLQSYGHGVPGLPGTSAEMFETRYRLDKNDCWDCSMVLTVSTFEGG